MPIDVLPNNSLPTDGQPDAARRGSRRRFRATLRAPWVRVLTTTLLVLAVLAYILGRTLPSGLGGLAARLFPPTVTRVVIPTTTPIIPTPAPATGPLAPPPSDCPVAPSLDSITAQANGFGGPVRLFGKSPVWVPEGYLPQNPTYLEQPGAAGPYPQLKIVWEIGPTEHPEVIVRVTDLRSTETEWWTNQAGTPATQILDLPANSAPGVYWTGGPTELAITHAGCYRLDVSWNGSGWYTFFAAGGGRYQ